VVAVVGQFAVSTGQASVGGTTHKVWVKANHRNELDCNGWGNEPVKSALRGLCTDPVKIKNGKAYRLIDNGWYVGHDEPSVKFISSQPGSGNQMTYFMRLPADPRLHPTVSGSVTKYGELSIAPWFGLPICDPLSYPQNPCTPDSDTNTGGISDSNAAGSAFMELQLYPPGFGPFQDTFSCSQKYWCAAMTIDSLECNFDFKTCNPHCEEPVNFAYLQTNGVPAGPPSPQLADVSSDQPNASTLKMYGGNLLEISIYDTPQGLTNVVRDLTTHQTGYMVASASNGFMDTNIANCEGTPFSFHPEYSTAEQQNQVPWAALEGGVIMEQEIGHFETCSSLANKDSVSENFGGGQTFSDPRVYQTCVGGNEGKGEMGEGPCNSSDICKNAETEGPTGPQACPTDNAGTGELCEFSDGYCFPKGPRTVMINGQAEKFDWPVAACNADQFQNGDLDFDGLPYQRRAWPNGTRNHPTPTEYIGPFTGGLPYPDIQFETDIAGSEFLCNTSTGHDCLAPPLGAQFYPYWTLAGLRHALGFSDRRGRHGGLCIWDFGKTISGVTKHSFGKDAEYGTSDTARYGGTVISSVLANPELSLTCGGNRRYGQLAKRTGHTD
jgi:hypothetical protein